MATAKDNTKRIVSQLVSEALNMSFSVTGTILEIIDFVVYFAAKN
jgi:hypothetical protein